MSNPYFGSSGLSIIKITPKLCLLIGLLPNIISGSLIGKRFLSLTSSKSPTYDLSSAGTQSNYGYEQNDFTDFSSSMSSMSPSSPSSTSYSTNSASYGLPNTKAYSQSSDPLDAFPSSSMAQSYPNSAGGSYPFPKYSPSSMGYPGKPAMNRFNYYGQPMRTSNSFNYPSSSLLPYGGLPSSSRYGSYPQYSSRFKGYYPYHRFGNRLRRNGYKPRYYKGRYSKRYRKPYYYGSRRYRSKYNSDYDYYQDSRETDSHIASESSPNETFYSFSTNNNSGSKDYLKIGGIGNNILSYLAGSILRGDPSKVINTNSTTNSSLDASKEPYDGPFIQFGETKITLKTNDKGGITVTVGRSKM
uniref:Uncharacterized protein n=2 Tax=Tetranychus urticae TaxID=32264 RepID=T1KRG2_TETUR